MEYAGYLCNEIAGACKNCGNLQKLRFDEKVEKKKKRFPQHLFSLGYYLNVKSHFLLLLMIIKHTTSQRVLGIFKFSSCFISDLNKHMAYKTLMSQTRSVALQKEYATTSLKMNK